MSGDRPAFEAHGHMSLRAACEQLIRGLAPGEHIMVAVAADECAELTGADWHTDAVRAAMYQASEAMINTGEAGARWVTRMGWIRMSANDMIDYAETRGKRAYRQVSRRGCAARAADPAELTADRRLRRDAALHSEQQLAALLGRRASRKRPQVPAVGAET